MRLTHVMHINTYLFAWVARLLAGVFLLNVPSEFWAQVQSLMAVPDSIKEIGAPVIGATCSTAAEVIVNAIERERLRREGKVITDYHDPTAKYWPLKIIIGSATGILGSSIIAPGVIAIIPSVSRTGTGFVAGAVGYWFLSKKLPKMLEKNEKEKDDEP